MVPGAPQAVDHVVDVLVVGYGGSGAVAAIEAARAGARVLLIEKSAHHGGLTMLCSGYMRVATDAAGAAEYLDRTNGGRVSRPLVEALAHGMTEIPALLEDYGRAVDARLHLSLGERQQAYETSDLYPWPGREAFGWAGIEQVPGFEGYPWVRYGGRGQQLMRVLEANVERSGVEVWLQTAAERLIVEDGTVTGLIATRAGQSVRITARGGVILACGGFEFNPQMLRDSMEIPLIHPMGHPGNTGDGIRMAQQAGASLWHMWHVHGSYGFKTPEMPVAIRNHLGGSRRAGRKLAWILVDQQGRRFTNELPPAPQDTASRPLAELNAETGRFDRIPAWMVFDEPARLLGPIGKPVASSPELYSDWSEDNAREIERGWILRAQTPRDLAARMGVPADALESTLSAWNAAVAGGEDAAFGRPPGTLTAVQTPPFHAIQVWPVVSNTQGGPRHDEHQRVLDAFDRPIPGLYAVGELGSFFGHIYLLGGNLSEGAAGGKIAGRRAAGRLDVPVQTAGAQ
ncbi:MAG: FAD-dependent oxidoreductase [Chloroflexota bacterium]